MNCRGKTLFVFNHPKSPFALQFVSVCTFAFMAALPLGAQAPAPHLYSVPSGGITQFPVRNGPATEDYVSLEKYSGIGQAVPKSFLHYSLKDEQNHTVSLAPLAGKVVVLDFWGTTCGPCLRAMPHLGKLARKYQTQNIVFLTVCESGSDIASYQAKAAQFRNPNLVFLRDPATNSHGIRSLLRYGGMGQPVQYILNQRSDLVGAFQGYDEVKDPDMKVLSESLDIVLNSKAGQK